MTTLADLPSLLHDATLEGGAWTPGELRLSFTCLRGDDDGSDLCGQPVEVILSGVEAVAHAVDASDVSVRPSAAELPPPLPGLCPWPLPAVGVECSINSAYDLETLAVAARTTWLWGSARATHTPLGLGLGVDTIRSATALLWVGATDLRVAVDGKPLSLEQWGDQCASWWNGWREHWAAEGITPKAPEKPQRHQPPDEPAFAIMDTDLPVALMATLRDWFEGPVLGDWARRTLACRRIDVSWQQDCADNERFADRHRWGYARAVEAWWIEGCRAFVQVRGIEHQARVGRYPAESVESVWQLSLRLRESRWHVVGSTQGWPIYGSAPALPEERKPWLASWGGKPVKRKK